MQPPVDARPFYGEFGWAYDLLVDDPVRPWADAVDAAIAARSPRDPARILDAGCGTGRHAAALTRRGHTLTLVDASPVLLAKARQRVPAAPALRAELESMELGSRFDAVACRGVLNDFCSDDDRTDVLRRFASHLVPGGLAILDVRELQTTAARYGGGRTTKRQLQTPRGALTFESSGHMDGGLLRISERHELRCSTGTRTEEFEFVMRPWTSEELCGRLDKAGFEEIEISGGAGREKGDRLLSVARRR